MRHGLVIFIALLAWHCCGNGVAYPSSVQTINSYYDPQAEFLELGVSYGNHTEWKLYGPDTDGQYGEMNGVGALDAVSPELSLFDPTVTDVRGDILGFYDSSTGNVTWNSARPTGYGAVPNYRPVALGSGGTLTQSSAWRGRCADITGYYNIGLRPYQNAQALGSRLNGYVDSLAGWTGQTTPYGGVVIQPGQVTARTLQVAIPQGSMSAAQQAVFNAAAQRAQGAGLNFIVTPIP